MDTPITKDYIDAKIEAAHERMSGELKAHQTAINARFDALELTIAFEMKSVRDAVDLKFARNEAQLQKIASDNGQEPERDHQMDGRSYPCKLRIHDLDS